jgi:non-heme chloroperoxidase
MMAQRADQEVRMTDAEQAGEIAAAITSDEEEQTARADADGRTPVVFVHGLWLLPSSWDRWAAYFDQAGFVPVTPGWPDDPPTVEQAAADPEVFAGKSVGDVADHLEAVVRQLRRRPVIIPTR